MELKVVFVSAFLLCFTYAAPAKKSESEEVPHQEAVVEETDLERQVQLANAMETAYSVIGFCRLYNLFDGKNDNFEPCVLQNENPTAELARECFVYLVLKTYPDKVHEDIFKCMGEFHALIQK